MSFSSPTPEMDPGTGTGTVLDVECPAEEMKRKLEISKRNKKVRSKGEM